MKSKTESFYSLRAKRPQVVTSFLYENNNENKTAGDAQMRGEWDGNNDRWRAIRVSFRSFFSFSTKRQVHSQASYDTHLECSYHSELSLLYSWLHLN